jgi:hypothetical protein
MRHMPRLFVAAAAVAIAPLSACGGSASVSGWTQSSAPSCSGGLCAEFERSDPAASIVIVTGQGALPAGDGYGDCGPVRGDAAACRTLTDREQVVWRGDDDLYYEASGTAITRAELVDFVSELDLKSAGLTP